MSAHTSRSRVVLSGAAVLALALVSGCGGTKAPTVATPTTSSPTVTETPTPSATPSATPSETTAPATAAAGSATLTKAGTTLKIGEVANVQIEYAGSKWVGGLKVTALEKAPASDLKELGVRDDAGSVYYLRYDVTYLAGTTKYPPTGSNISWTRLHPLATQGARLSLINISRFKKCTTIVYKDGGGIDREKEELAVGETATNMCLPFVVDKGALAQVVHNFYDLDKKEDQTITWK